jgi:Sec-independent protein translocase protein TatA
MPDMIFIVLLTLVIFGPKKLPKIARQCGMYLAQSRRMKDEVMNQIEGEMLKLEADNSFNKTVDDSNRSQIGVAESNPLGAERLEDVCTERA